MWNMNDVYVANERIEDMRRAADKHNAIARMKAEQSGKQPGEKLGKKRNNKQRKLWEQMRNALR